MHTVAAVIDQGALTFDFAIPCEVFGLDRSDIVYALVRVPRRRGRRPPRADADRLRPRGAVRAARSRRARTRSSSRAGATRDDRRRTRSATRSRGAHDRGARIVSLCTGAFVLAEAGLLDGRRATTHWMYVDRLRARYPDVELDPDVLYVADGDVMTSAGTAAGIDLCLHIVALDHGAEVAADGRAAARDAALPRGRSGAVRRHPDRRPMRRRAAGAVLDWARDHLGAGITVGRPRRAARR